MNYLVMGFRASGRKPGWSTADYFNEALNTYRAMRSSNLYETVVMYKIYFDDPLEPLIIVLGASKEEQPCPLT